ncbi:nuclear transport factor 2 family protein [Caenimonas sedimenti]|uniref:Nuclear transport factor 2 family protein n=1 Tax=Caenimonas sedimenti TaxID=2596921 RepID=A0A562ZEW4_9BURK|nr:nuclear transport factor 2 family protein [Caenimonas sedimenti]TWO64897.1 nuclear transport factor 2 family protein [Caenimonas sedimenti]
MSGASGFAEVSALLAEYFDGLHHSDSARLARVFHPEAHYFTATGGTLVHLDMARYLPIVEARPSPASRGEARSDRILAIEFAGPVTAFAKVNCSIAPRQFTDFLTLLKVDGAWRIVAKVFHYEVVEPSP